MRCGQGSYINVDIIYVDAYLHAVAIPAQTAFHFIAQSVWSMNSCSSCLKIFLPLQFNSFEFPCTKNWSDTGSKTRISCAILQSTALPQNIPCRKCEPSTAKCHFNLPRASDLPTEAKQFRNSQNIKEQREATHSIHHICQEPNDVADEIEEEQTFSTPTDIITRRMIFISSDNLNSSCSDKASQH